jgi:hypothetical protein
MSAEVLVMNKYGEALAVDRIGALRGVPAVGVESNGVRTRGILPPLKKMPAYAGVTTLLLIVLKATL